MRFRWDVPSLQAHSALHGERLEYKRVLAD